MISRELHTGWIFRRVGEDDWLPATVPGCVHTDLMAAGRIGDPFWRTNEKRLGWIERQDWEYRLTFTVDGELLAHDRVELVFEGLDTYAQVTLNGAPLLSADNMFRSWRVPATLRLGENELRVHFRSPIEAAKPLLEAQGFALEAVNDQAEPKLSVFTRKAPYHYGWDWGPRLVTSGLWRPVRLEAWNDVRIEDVRVIQRALDDERAVLDVAVTLEAARACEASVQIAGGRSDVSLGAGVNRVTLPLVIENPRRWWPNGLGEPHLQTVDVQVRTARAHAEASRRIGLRTIRLVHERDAHGKSFHFEVNGAPVFCKGANWIPADSFPTRMTPARYRELLQAAADAHMNMLRVWGGGIYEERAFYDLCDELGLMVWQDFMFACSLYPDDEAFLENVQREAVENVVRLRNHACLAIWAGNNEIEAAWHHWGWKVKHAVHGRAPRVWAAYERLFHQVLPAVVAAHDPQRPYTRSSPSANEESHVNERGWGDMHYWGVWHLELPYTAYDANVSRFMSEYGFQSFPEPASVAAYTEPEDRRIDSEVMLAHQRHKRGNALIAAYLAQSFPAPRDFESFLYVGQVLQAEVIKYGAETHRRNMPYCMGSLYWQLDDCWPVASWSGIDYYGRWKALHHYARRFFAPVLPIVRQEQGEIVVHVANDQREAVAGKLEVRVLTFDGRVVSTTSSDVTIAPLASPLAFRGRTQTLLAGAAARECLIVAALLGPDGRITRNILPLASLKETTLPDPGLRVEVSDRLVVTVRAARFARNVWLTSTEPGRFSDNHFHLLPGESAEVTFQPIGPVEQQRFASGLEVRTLADAF